MARELEITSHYPAPKGLAGDKSTLRKIALNRRDALDVSLRAALSQAIIREITTLAAYRRSSVVMAYTSFGSELQTGSFLRSVLEEGKALILPRVNREKGSLDLYEVEDLAQDLETGVWGIREPRTDLTPVELEVVDFALVPGVAFDARGGRLGYGAGFYDRLLGGSTRRPRLVAGAFEAQMLEEIPLDQHDVLMDLVITESRPRPISAGATG